MAARQRPREVSREREVTDIGIMAGEQGREFEVAHPGPR